MRKVFFALAAALALAVPAVAQTILVYSDDRLQTIAPDEPLEVAGDLEHAWRWSQDSAPRRVAREDLDRELPRDRQHLSVRIDHHGERLEPGYRLRAAPVEMWAEIPESLLPSWGLGPGARAELPLDPTRPWRLRVEGPRRGTWWVDVPAGRRTARLTPLPAENRTVAIVDTEGETLDKAYFTLLAADDDRRGILAQARTDGSGKIVWPSLPDEGSLQVIVNAEGCAPTALTARPATLPGEVRLRPGATLKGRFVDTDGEPLAGVAVRADAWISDRASATVERRGTSSTDGTWSLETLPPGKIALAAEAPGFSIYSARVESGAEGLDLGTIELQRGKALPVLVVDDLGAPVAGARVEAAPREPSFTGSRGEARLEDLPAADSVRVGVRAPGHLPAERIVVQPFPDEARLEIRRAFRVAGRYLDADGVPVDDGAVRVEQGTRYDDREIGGDGRFDLDLEPGVGVRLIFRSASTDELRVPVEAGAAGEARDLGDLRAPAGIKVRGTLLRATDATPIPGARVWTPRPSSSGDAVAWAHGDLLTARSDLEGTFEIRGLARRPALLRIDAPGLARAHVQIDPEDVRILDLGELLLSRGATVRVFSPGPENALARVDLRGQWLELDMLTAGFSEAEARVPHVPPGTATVTVVDGRRFLCEETVEIADGDDLVDVDCRDTPMRVSGHVASGGEPAGAGLLMWMPESSADVPGIIMNRDTPLGARQQRTFGAGRPQVDVEVDGGGYFHSDALRPGRWRVHWIPSDGALSAPELVELPGTEDYELTLAFGGLALTGFVLDEDDRPVAGARVRHVDGEAMAFSRSDGSFSLIGLDAGPHRVHARLETRTSQVADAVIEPDGDSRPVFLRIRDNPDEKVEVLVLNRDGEPSAGAFVFFEGLGQNGRILTTDLAGKAAASFQPPYPEKIRVAKVSDGQWTFGSWLGLEQAAAGVTLTTSSTGALRLASDELTGVPVIRSEEGWDLSWLLTRIGTRPLVDPRSPLEIQGLPEGTYLVELDGARTTVTVEEDRRTEAELPLGPAD